MSNSNTWVSPEDQSIRRAESMKKRLEERSERMLDPRQRRLGLDIDAIQKQIEDKKLRQAREKARNDAFDHMLLEQQEMIMKKREDEINARHYMAEQEDTYRHANQNPDQSREYDIWRSDIKQVTEPIRKGDEDARLGISAGQIFQGEDLRCPARMEAQRKQMEEWHAEQMREKQMIKDKETAEDLRNQIVELETQKQLVQLHEQTEAAKAAVRQQLADDNMRLAQEKKQREKQDNQHDEEMIDAHRRENARTRVITEYMTRRGDAPMEYRGMTIDDQKEIIDEQARQMEENDRIRHEEQERENQWNEYQAYLRAQGDINEAEYMRKRQQAAIELAEFQKKQAAEHKERQRYLNRDLYGTNDPQNSYYDQWGTSIR